MSNLYIGVYAERNPEHVNESVRDRIVGHDGSISPNVLIGENVRIGNVQKVGYGSSIGVGSELRQDVSVGGHVSVGDAVLLGGCVKVENNVSIGSFTTIRAGAIIGREVQIYDRSFIGRNAQLPPVTNRRNGYHHEAHLGVIIGHDVTLPDEFQLGNYTVVPNNNTIHTIGRLGTSQRMVTIYGSENGPLYSVGCQYGMEESYFRNRIDTTFDTSVESAADYLRYWEVLTAAGLMVQRAYDCATTQVEDLRAEANQALEMRNQAFSRATS